MNTIDIQSLINIARKAGEAILEIYHHSDFSSIVDFKTDNSPLTLADKASHEVIMSELTKQYPEIPIISEEGEEILFEERKHWERFWLVDPLDGTKEFIKRNGEFTVNIALIHQGRAVLGIVFSPVQNIYYCGEQDKGAFKLVEDTKTVLKINNNRLKSIAVRSKSHPSPEEEIVLQKYGVTNSMSVGSSLKFCMVADGEADIYYRHGPTMEWDTAAGQAVLEAAGGRMFLGNSEENPFTYNKESLLNGSFLCLG
jgi:3'(2'), 5'-bisphosphate nucleotidase